MKKIELNDVIFYVIGLFFIAFVIWAKNAEIDQVVRAEARVEPATKVQKIQSIYPGSVGNLYVEVGNTVSKDQVVLDLDKSDVQISYNTVIEQIKLTEQELEVFKLLVEAGIEPKIRLIEIKQRLLEAQHKMAKYALQLVNSDVKSPIDGVITAVHVLGSGSVLSGGEVLIEVIPQVDYFVVKAKLLPKDMANVFIGQKSRVSFTAYDFSRFGVMEGVVTKIAQNTTETKQGEIYYDAWIKTKGDKLSNSAIIPNILPGMIATVDLLGSKLTVLEYISSPLKKGVARAFTEQ